jgi:hypothetical protein
MNSYHPRYPRINLLFLLLAAIGGCTCSSYALHPRTRKQVDVSNRLRSPFIAEKRSRTFRIVRDPQQNREPTNVNSSAAVAINPETVYQKPLPANPTPKTADEVKPKIAEGKDKLSVLDYTIFITYFCNIIGLTLSVVTVPAMALEYNLSPRATTAFCASIASMVPLGGAVGKLVNGFVCQYLGGQKSSWMYLVGLAGLQLAMSFTKSLAPIALLLISIEFLTSIQWTSICAVLGQSYRQSPRRLARGITILSVSSTVGALAAKTIGAGLLQMTNWRTVCRFGSFMALIGATAMYFGGSDTLLLNKNGNNKDGLEAATRVAPGGQQRQSPLLALRSILKSPVFWMTGMGHSLGSLTRSSDRLLGPFLQEIGGISGTMAAGMTSSVTIGFVLGLLQGNMFSKMESVKGKMSMIKRNYVVSVLSTMGLAACGIKGVSNLVGGNVNIVMAAITVFSGIIASAVSFQFYNFANLMSSTMFPEHSSVALSLTDAVGFFTTAGILGINSRLLGKFGWCASWAFMASAFAFGGISMTRAIQPVLAKGTHSQRK